MNLPPQHLHAFIDEIQQAQSIEALHNLCSRLCATTGFDHFFLGMRFPVSLVKPHFVFISGYPTDWWTHYNDMQYLPIDPIVRHAACNMSPLLWQDIDTSSSQHPTVRNFMQESRDFGLLNGFSTPVHGSPGETSLVSLSTGDSKRQLRDRIDNALGVTQLLATHLHEAVKRVMQALEPGLINVTLTNREIQCLLWSAEGKSTWSIAKILTISENTVLFHLKNAATKLNAGNRQQAVARAISMGLITPQFN